MNLWPWGGEGHGPLPLLLLVLTVVTGVVDAVSFIALGRVFVANMTGNVVFLGFALGGAPGLSMTVSLVALGAFLAGALVGGRIGRHLDGHRGNHLAAAGTLGLGLILAALVVAAVAEHPRSGGAQYALVVLLACALGIQNATARRLAVPDLTTSVLTQTLTGLAADSPLGAGRAGEHAAAGAAGGGDGRRGLRRRAAGAERGPGGPDRRGGGPHRPGRAAGLPPVARRPGVDAALLSRRG